MDYWFFHEGLQLDHVQQRIAELEARHNEISLRVQAPSFNSPLPWEDEANLKDLEDSLGILRGHQSILLGRVQAPSTS